MCSIVQWHFVLVFIIIKLWTMQWSQNIQQIVLNGAIHHQLTLNFFLCSQCYTMLSLEKNAPFVVNFVFSLIHYISLPKKNTYMFLAISEDVSQQLFVVFCLYKSRSCLWSQNLWKTEFFTIPFIASHLTYSTNVSGII